MGSGFNQGMEEGSATWVSDAGVHNSFRFVVGFFLVARFVKKVPQKCKFAPHGEERGEKAGGLGVLALQRVALGFGHRVSIEHFRRGVGFGVAEIVERVGDVGARPD